MANQHLHKWIYHRSPYIVRCMIASWYGWIQRRKRYGEYFHRHLKAIEKSQWFSHEELDVLQLERTKVFLVYAKLHSQFYHKLFLEFGFEPESMRSLTDLCKLPVINKTIVHRNLDSIISDDIATLGVIWSNTSGTTGQGLRFPESLESFQREYAFRFQSYSWAGAHIHKRWAFCAGHPVASADCVKPPYWIYDKSNDWLLMSSYHLAEENLPHYIHALEKFKPEMLSGYPSSIFLLALYNKKMGSPVQPYTIVTSSETLLDYQRRAIEDSFRCKAFSYYGNAERAGCMSQCENRLFHLRAEHSYVEILDEYNRPARPGMPGRLVVTAFGNYATPLIRYDVGDVATISEKRTCKCGREGTLIDNIIGRMEDYIVTPDGRYIGRLDHLFKGTTNVLMGQIQQDNINELRIRIVKDTHFSAKDEAIIRKEAHERLGHEMKVHFEYLDDIPSTKEGKFRFVISNIEKGGSEHTLISEIWGHRNQEVLIAKDGSEISWATLNMQDDTFMHVRQFHFFQETPGQAILRIVPTDGFGEEDISRIHRNLEHKLDSRLALTIDFVEDIPLSARGKAIYVDQRIQPEK